MLSQLSCLISSIDVDWFPSRSLYSYCCQEAHLDLLSSLLHESGLTHIRRITPSMIVYLSLAATCVYIPACICRMYLGQRLEVRLWTLVPELRVPVELALLHLSFLTLLDSHKDVFGTIQFHWLRLSCKWLGLSRYLLPHECIPPPVRILLGQAMMFDSFFTVTTLERASGWLRSRLGSLIRLPVHWSDKGMVECHVERKSHFFIHFEYNV